jgi:predicted aspartyl protease
MPSYARLCLGLIGCALYVLPVAAAETCTLKKVAELPADTDHGALLIKIQINGQDAQVLMDTGSPFEMISRQFADKLNLPLQLVREGAAMDGSGKFIRHMVRVHQVGLGTMTANDVPFLVLGEAGDKPLPFDGVFSANFLASYDVELDLAHKKVNLFLKDHCPGQVVYWTQDYDVIPFKTDASLHAVFSVKLEGQALSAILDTGASLSTLSQRTAERIINFDPARDGIKPDGNVRTGTGALLPYYRHRFASLEIGGVAFHNTEFDIMPDKTSNYKQEHNPITPHADFEENMANQVTIGLHHLLRLRAYIAYEEQKIYISAADAQ